MEAEWSSGALSGTGAAPAEPGAARDGGRAEAPGTAEVAGFVADGAPAAEAGPDLAAPERAAAEAPVARPDAAPDRAPDAARATSPLEVGLVGYWPFDDGSGSVAKDGSGAGNAGTFVGAPRWTASGRLGGAIEFSGAAGYVAVANPPDGRLDPGAHDVTVAVWVDTAQAVMAGMSPEFVNKMSSGTMPAERWGWELFTQGSTSRTQFKIWSGTSNVAASATRVHDGKWHHLAGRKTATTIELFVDGVLSESRPHTLDTLGNTAAVHVGSWDGLSGAALDGRVDDLRIYGRALSNAEIAALAAGQTQ